MICIALLSVSLTPSLFSFYQPPVDPITSVITASANADGVSNTDLAIWYSIYHGTELYGTKFDFENAKGFGVLFDKQRKIRDKLLPDKTTTLGVEINKILKKYEEIPFDDNSKNQFIEECASIGRGIKAAID